MPFAARFAMVALLALPAAAETVETLAPDTTIADFNAALPAGIEASRLRIAREVDAATDSGSLHVLPGEGPAEQTPAFWLPLAGRVDPATCGGITLNLKGTAPGELVRLRLGACDEQGRLILQRIIIARADGVWRPMEFALNQFYWGDRAGGWREARSLRLAIETPFESLDVDDLRLTPPADPKLQSHQRMAQFAFPGKNVRMIRTDTLLLATDVAGVLSDADLQQILNNMIRAQVFVRRLFGNAVRRIDDPAPSALFIFNDARDCTTFWRRYGATWGGTIIPPAWGAYAIQDIATSVFDPVTGANRPTFVHEAIHAIIAREVRLAPGRGNHGWIQEGVANYVQLSLYPGSFAAGEFTRAFAAGVKEGPDALFLPMGRLFNGPVSTTNYAQIASFVAYVAEAHPQWFPAIGAGLADGEPMDRILARCGTDIAAVETAWLDWGRKRFAQSRADHFAPPAEWATP